MNTDRPFTIDTTDFSLCRSGGSRDGRPIATAAAPAYMNKVLAALAILLALLIVACSPFQTQKADPVDTHVLDARLETSTVAGAGALTLAVSTPRAAAGYDTARIAYLRRPHEIEYFAKNEWVDTPSRMLAPLIVRALEQGGGFMAVVPASSPVVGDLRLDTEIIRLQQEFDTTPSRVRFMLRAQLVDPVTRRVVRSHLFDVSETAPSDDPRGGVIAANLAVAGVLAEMVEFVRGR